MKQFKIKYVFFLVLFVKAVFKTTLQIVRTTSQNGAHVLIVQKQFGEGKFPVYFPGVPLGIDYVFRRIHIFPALGLHQILTLSKVLI